MIVYGQNEIDSLEEINAKLKALNNLIVQSSENNTKILKQIKERIKKLEEKK